MPDNNESRQFPSYEEYVQAFATALKEAGISPEEFKDFIDPSKRHMYLKKARNLEAVAQPTPEEELDLMKQISRSRLEERNEVMQTLAYLFENRQLLDEAYSNSEIARKKIQVIREQKQLLTSSPKWMIWLAKTLLFFKGLFKRKNV